MTWLLPLVVAAVGAVAVATALRRCHDEISPARDAFGRYGAEVRPALVRVRSEAAAVRERLARLDD